MRTHRPLALLSVLSLLAACTDEPTAAVVTPVPEPPAPTPTP